MSSGPALPVRLVPNPATSVSPSRCFPPIMDSCKPATSAGVVGFLQAAGIDPVPFHDFDINPDTEMVQRGADFARQRQIDSIIGLGGGSSLDCAKGINFILTNGGTMACYRGYGKAREPMLPMLALPTTAGTGSEAQSYAVIADPTTKMKMACGDPKAAFRTALLDPELTAVTAEGRDGGAGFDALAHAVETAVTTRRNPPSLLYSREAFRLLNDHIEIVLGSPDSIEARGAMQLGAHYAGVAIEHSMLGAAHACANPLTARYDVPHGAALAILLPCVVRWNAEADHDLYQDLVSEAMPQRAATGDDCGDLLAGRIVEIGSAADSRSVCVTWASRTTTWQRSRRKPANSGPARSTQDHLANPRP